MPKARTTLRRSERGHAARHAGPCQLQEVRPLAKTSTPLKASNLYQSSDTDLSSAPSSDHDQEGAGGQTEVEDTDGDMREDKEDNNGEEDARDEDAVVEGEKGKDQDDKDEVDQASTGHPKDEGSSEQSLEETSEVRERMRIGIHKEDNAPPSENGNSTRHNYTNNDSRTNVTEVETLQLATQVDAAQFLADIRKATSSASTEIEKGQLISLLCDSGLGELRGNDHLGRERRKWLVNHGINLKSKHLDPDTLCRMGLVTELEKAQLGRNAQARDGLAELKVDTACLLGQWDEEEEVEHPRDKETLRYLREIMPRVEGLLDLVVPGFSGKTR